MTFDIEKHLVSIILDTKENADEEFKKFIEENIEKGKLSRSLKDTCDVENTYDPMKERKLLKEIGH